MISIAALTQDTWTVVARRVTRPERDSWQWLIPPADRAALTLARNAGRIVTAQQRADDGTFRLMARLVRPRRRAGAQAFAQLGMGMFEQ